MPERLAYDEAMQFSTIRLKVQDPELKQGKVEMVSISTKQGSIERPWGIEGGFAVVYKFRRKNGTLCALRCFRVPMNPDTQFRYERIGPYFHTHARDITAGFRYYDEAIVVKEQGKPPNQKYPVIEMDWIDGVTLVDKVNELCKKRQKMALKDLATQWVAMLRIMAHAHIAHGDLAGVNVMVRVDGKLVLIDYDGVYIPELASLSQILLGQDDFQHPQMTQRQFHEHMDAFSALVIYTALIALSVKPELWDNYAKIGLDGTLLDVNILFRQQDFRAPQQSQLFQELEQVGDAYLTTLVQELKRACQQAINDVRFPFALIDPHYDEKQALARLESTIQAHEDEQIVAAWLPILEHYPPAQRYRNRVQLARQRVGALQTFRMALGSGNLQHILNNYDPALLDPTKSISQEERLALSHARAFLQAYRNNNDDALDIAEKLQNTMKGTHVVFTATQQQRLAQIRQRKNAQMAMQAAFASKNIEQIAAIDPLLQYLTSMTVQERQHVEQAVAFMQAYSSADDNAFLITYDSLQQGPTHQRFVFTPAQEKRATQIRKCNEASERFHIALASKSPSRLVKAYDPVLDNSTQITMRERELLTLARLLTAALLSGDDDHLLAADDTVQQSTHHMFFQLTFEEKQRFILAQQRKAALLNFRGALKSGVPSKIVAEYSTILVNDGRVSQEERTQLSAARLFVNAFAADDEESLVAVGETLHKPGISGIFLVTQQEQARIDLAKRRLQALERFHRALRVTPTNAQSIIDAYDSSLLHTSKAVNDEQREMVAAAQRYLAMYETIKEGIRADSDDIIRNAYDATLAQRFVGISSAEQRRIDRGMLLQTLEDLLDKKEYEQALLMVQSIQKTTGREVSDLLTFKLKRATMRFIRQQDLSNLRIQVEERVDTNYAVVSWQWPTTTLIHTALIVWQSGAWPDRPAAKCWNDPEWNYVWVRRKNDALSSNTTFSIGKGTHIYVRGYAALLDIWDQEKIWRFSSGDEPTSYAEVASPQMTWRMQ